MLNDILKNSMPSKSLRAQKPESLQIYLKALKFGKICKPA